MMRGPYRQHRQLDNSVVCLEAEDIPHHWADFDADLLEDMGASGLCMDGLKREYPELTFSRVILEKDAGRPKDVDYAVKRHTRGGLITWMCAKWRTAA